MRRIAPLGLFLLLLTGCSGFGQFISDTHTFQPNPNMPPINSENMLRVTGQDATQQALTPEPGNIWPPPSGPMPTLLNLEQQPGNTGQNPVTPPAVGSGATPPPIPPGGLGPEAPMPTPKASTMPSIGPALPKLPPTYQTPAGPAVTTGGGAGYSTTTTPGSAGQSIVVPNGNGTSTIIHADGTVETVPTPK
jgi:hypothetical protein